MKETNAQIKAFIEQHDYLYYTDTASPLLDADGQPRNDLLLKDGLHLNAEGYRLWTSVVAPVIEDIQNK